MQDKRHRRALERRVRSGHVAGRAVEMRWHEEGAVVIRVGVIARLCQQRGGGCLERPGDARLHRVRKALLLLLLPPRLQLELAQLDTLLELCVLSRHLAELLVLDDHHLHLLHRVRELQEHRGDRVDIALEHRQTQTQLLHLIVAHGDQVVLLLQLRLQRRQAGDPVLEIGHFRRQFRRALRSLKLFDGHLHATLDFAKDRRELPALVQENVQLLQLRLQRHVLAGQEVKLVVCAADLGHLVLQLLRDVDKVRLELLDLAFPGVQRLAQRLCLAAMLPFADVLGLCATDGLALERENLGLVAFEDGVHARDVLHELQLVGRQLLHGGLLHTQVRLQLVDVVHQRLDVVLHLRVRRRVVDARRLHLLLHLLNAVLQQRILLDDDLALVRLVVVSHQLALRLHQLLLQLLAVLPHLVHHDAVLLLARRTLVVVRRRVHRVKHARPACRRRVLASAAALHRGGTVFAPVLHVRPHVVAQAVLQLDVLLFGLSQLLLQRLDLLLQRHLALLQRVLLLQDLTDMVGALDVDVLLRAHLVQHQRQAFDLLLRRHRVLLRHLQLVLPVLRHLLDVVANGHGALCVAAQCLVQRHLQGLVLRLQLLDLRPGARGLLHHRHQPVGTAEDLVFRQGRSLRKRRRDVRQGLAVHALEVADVGRPRAVVTLAELLAEQNADALAEDGAHALDVADLLLQVLHLLLARARLVRLPRTRTRGGERAAGVGAVVRDGVPNLDGVSLVGHGPDLGHLLLVRHKGVLPRQGGDRGQRLDGRRRGGVEHGGFVAVGECPHGALGFEEEQLQDVAFLAEGLDDGERVRVVAGGVDDNAPVRGGPQVLLLGGVDKRLGPAFCAVGPLPVSVPQANMAAGA
eukprot:Rhum_TRINITY_DN7219_c0_g1::Rhum_TRINITY_DN7219_c0_g1_i1::g.22236::m.22236